MRGLAYGWLRVAAEAPTCVNMLPQCVREAPEGTFARAKCATGRDEGAAERAQCVREAPEGVYGRAKCAAGKDEGTAQRPERVNEGTEGALRHPEGAAETSERLA